MQVTQWHAGRAGRLGARSADVRREARGSRAGPRPSGPRRACTDRPAVGIGCPARTRTGPRRTTIPCAPRTARAPETPTGTIGTPDFSAVRKPDFLNGPEASVAGPRALGEDEDGRALREAPVELREDVPRLVGPPPVHGHEAREPHRPAHERHPEERPLREEAHVLTDRRGAGGGCRSPTRGSTCRSPAGAPPPRPRPRSSREPRSETGSPGPRRAPRRGTCRPRGGIQDVRIAREPNARRRKRDDRPAPQADTTRSRRRSMHEESSDPGRRP